MFSRERRLRREANATPEKVICTTDQYLSSDPDGVLSDSILYGLLTVAKECFWVTMKAGQRACRNVYHSVNCVYSW